jgi:hypothetical protein
MCAVTLGRATRLLNGNHPSFVQCPRGVGEMDRPPGLPIGLKFFFDEVDEVHEVPRRVAADNPEISYPFQAELLQLLRVRLK